MNELAAFATFATIWGLCVMTPGANFFVTAQVGLSSSRQLAVLVALGISIATAVWGVIGFTGITLLISDNPWSFLMLQLLGGSYLIYMGGRMLLSTFRTATTPSHRKQHSESEALSSIRTGFITNLSNPKTAIFVTSLFATTQTGNPTLTNGVIQILIMMLLSLTWYIIVALVFSSTQMANRYHQFQRHIDRIAGIALLGFGLKVAFTMLN